MITWTMYHGPKMATSIVCVLIGHPLYLLNLIDMEYCETKEIQLESFHMNIATSELHVALFAARNNK